MVHYICMFGDGIPVGAYRPVVAYLPGDSTVNTGIPYKVILTLLWYTSGFSRKARYVSTKTSFGDPEEDFR